MTTCLEPALGTRRAGTIAEMRKVAEFLAPRISYVLPGRKIKKTKVRYRLLYVMPTGLYSVPTLVLDSVQSPGTLSSGPLLGLRRGLGLGCAQYMCTRPERDSPISEP